MLLNYKNKKRHKKHLSGCQHQKTINILSESYFFCIYGLSLEVSTIKNLFLLHDRLKMANQVLYKMTDQHFEDDQPTFDT